jgi:glucose/arabinose dehydrogenase
VRRRGVGLALTVLALSFSGPSEGAGGADSVKLEKIKLPPGFRIELYSAEVPNARSMVRGAEGTIFVGTRTAGNLYALLDRDRDQRADQVLTLARGLNMPNGVAFRDGALYVAEVNRILRYDGIESRLSAPKAPVVLREDLPRERHHGWKYIAFGPDGWLYVPVGAPCNICESSDPRFASILRLKPDGSEVEIFAHGVRNTVGFDWHPLTRELWFTDNGRDWMGDDRPPDELNHAPRPGLHFGYPYRHGSGIVDPKYGRLRADEFVPPALDLGPHVAALALRFYTGTLFPPEYRQQAFIAEHGSWNRTVPIGYRVMRVRFEAGRPASYEPFATGWLDGAEAWGRPVDLLQMPDGALLLSDDEAGAIYRISYQK